MLNRMARECTVAKNTTGKPGLRHWLLQLLPPLSMLSVLLMTTSGTSLVFLVGFLLLPVLISLLSLLVKLVFFRQRKYYLARPLLTIAVFVLVLAIAEWTYAQARNQALDEARRIQRLCAENRGCPQRPPGWLADGSRIRKSSLGTWMHYPAAYFLDGENFRIRLYRGPDVGDILTGGPNADVDIQAYVES